MAAKKRCSITSRASLGPPPNLWAQQRGPVTTVTGGESEISSGSPCTWVAARGAVGRQFSLAAPQPWHYSAPAKCPLDVLGGNSHQPPRQTSAGYWWALSSKAPAKKQVGLTSFQASFLPEYSASPKKHHPSQTLLTCHKRTMQPKPRFISLDAHCPTTLGSRIWGSMHVSISLLGKASRTAYKEATIKFDDDDNKNNIYTQAMLGGFQSIYIKT